MSRSQLGGGGGARIATIKTTAFESGSAKAVEAALKSVDFKTLFNTPGSPLDDIHF